MATQIVPAPASADHAALPPAARDAMRRLELALTKPDTATVEKVRVALGLQAGWRPRAYLGETATYLTMWSQMELNTLFERVGGTATTRQVERSIPDGVSTWTATEITLTVGVAGVGPVEVVTDIEDDPEHGYRTDVPVVVAARLGDAQAACSRLSAAAETVADFDRLLCLQDEMTMCRCRLTAVTPEVKRAVVVFEIAFAAVDRLSRVDARDMTGAQFDSLADAQQRMDDARATLAAAGQLHLIEVGA